MQIYINIMQVDLSSQAQTQLHNNRKTNRQLLLQSINKHCLPKHVFIIAQYTNYSIFLGQNSITYYDI